MEFCNVLCICVTVVLVVLIVSVFCLIDTLRTNDFYRKIWQELDYIRDMTNDYHHEFYSFKENFSDCFDDCFELMKKIKKSQGR